MRSFAKVFLVFLASLGAANQAQANWVYSETADRKVVSVRSCDPDKPQFCVGLKCVAFGKPALYWTVDAPDNGSTIMSTISLWIIDSAAFVLEMDKAGPPENGNQHFEDKFVPGDVQFFNGMKSGKKLAIKSDTIGRFKVPLSGSGVGISAVTEACESAKAATAQSAPDRDSPSEIVRRVFENNSCFATESQLFDALSSRLGVSLANKAVVELANSDQVTVISRSPHTYRYSGNGVCKVKGQAKPGVGKSDFMDNRFDELKSQIFGEVREQCKSGSKITYADSAFSVTEKATVLVRLGHFDCDWLYTTNYFCGAKACTVREYEVDGSSHALVREFLQ